LLSSDIHHTCSVLPSEYTCQAVSISGSSVSSDSLQHAIFGPRPHDDPTISAYEGLYKQKYDFLAHPIAPFGTAVLIYETPEERKSWADHGVPGYYLGPTPNSYRTFRVYSTRTRGFRDAETLAWFPEDIHMPGSDPKSTLLAAIESLNNNIRTTVDLNIQKEYLRLSELLRQSIDLFHGSVHASRDDVVSLNLRASKVSLKTR